jgi:phospholipase/lecithinase/hemolysin
MKKFRVLAAALAASAFLAGCGGSDPGNQTPRVTYGHMVNFGDSLSDVGTYRVSFVAAAGGGYYSINGDTSAAIPHTNWTEFLAATLQLPAPCAAETGLDTATNPQLPYPPVPPVFHDAGKACVDYAQGGARVTDPHGPGNAFYFNPNDPSTYANAIGQLTVPVTTQIDNYLATNGPAFASDDLVTVFAGGNDLFIQAEFFNAMVAHGVPPQTAAQTVVTAMGQAGGELAGYVKGKILANGATHVVVINVPDVSLTPYALAAEQASPGAQALVKQMTQTFNDQLAAGLAGTEANVMQVDLFTASEAQTANPSQFGLTNVTTPACDLNVVPNSLVCTANTLLGASQLQPPPADIQTYAYADSVHPTPYAYRLIAQLVSQQMALQGWL